MSGFQKKLKAIQRFSGLTCSDLARVFKVPFPTMRCWLVDGAEPIADTSKALAKLEGLSHYYGQLLELPQRKRSAHLKRLLRAK